MTTVEEIRHGYEAAGTREDVSVPGSMKVGNATYQMILDVLPYIDGLATGLTAFLAYAVIHHTGTENLASVSGYHLAVPAMTAGILFYMFVRDENIHDLSKPSSEFSATGQVPVPLSATFSALLIAAVLLQSVHNYTALWFALWFALAMLAVVSIRTVTHFILRHFARRGAFSKRVAIISSRPEIAARIRNELLGHGYGTGVVSTFNEKQSQLLYRQGLDEAFDQIIVAIPFSEEDLLLETINTFKALPLELHICAGEQPSGVRAFEYQTLGDFELHLIHGKPISGWSMVQKSVLDYALGTISLMIFAPVMALIAVAIKLDSKGPVFFRQRRHGFNHRQIEVLKFRTMTVMEDGDVIRQAQKNDARVTRVGKFLRMTSLDELPQLINVFRGEMSLVGPRPHALAHNQQYSALIEKYANRHHVKPGITGWAQINGFRGPTEELEDMQKRAQCDLYYIDNWSIWLDIKIIIMTPFFGFIGRNAF